MAIIAPQYIGYNPPIFGGHQNILSRQAGDRLIKNDLLQLLLTSFGERVMRPRWGTALRTTVFDNIAVENLDSLVASVASSINSIDDRVAATVSAHIVENQVVVTVSGYYTDLPEKRFEIELGFPVASVENNNG
jgi:phage baseplate assembly protein W